VPSDAIPFSSLAPDSKFYFVADANRSFLWVKTSDSSASNTVNQKVASIPATTYVRAEASASVGERPPAASERTAEQISVDVAYERRYGLPVRRNTAPTNAPPAPANPQ
jgi:hypothetical protein